MIRTQRVYAVTASSVAIAVIAVGFAAVGYVRHEERTADTQVAASRIEAANLDLQDELARLRDQVSASGRDLAAAQSRVAALIDEEKARAQHDEHQTTAVEQTATGKGDKAAQLAGALHAAEAQRATLAARLSKAEADLLDQQARQNQLQTQIEQWQKKLEQVTADHDKAIAERDKLKARVGELEKQSQLRHAAQSVAMAQPEPATSPPTAATPPAAVAAPPPAAAPQPAEAPSAQRVAGILNAPPPATLPQPAVASQPAAVASQPAAVASRTPAIERGATEQFERILASAGVDVRHLFAEFGVNRAEGGPFVPVPPGQAVNPGLSPEKLAALRAMIKTLPVSAPLTEYRVTSPFGVREDPENEREGFHTGIDLAAPYDTPVYATAPGTVTYAGWRDDYGKIVEIDHGNGIATRYAHLHQIIVSVGQRVAVHQQVGYLGSSGRATGPHVHYEVVVNGEPQDPEKFFALSRYAASMTVPVAARN